MRKNYTAAVYVLDNARATDGIVACRLLLKRLDLKAEQEIRELDNGEHNNLEMLMKWWGFENQDKLLIVGTWRWPYNADPPDMPTICTRTHNQDMR